jgi:FecR-like protein
MLPFASKLAASPVLCAIAALAIALATPAFGRIGVTSQTDGDPLGKPPTQNERVLRVGIDIQANEVVTTKADDRAHIVFLDGTALTVAPNARLTIDRFVYDPDKKLGDLAVTVSTGVFRLVGGKISKQGTISIKTPSATIGLRGGIGLFVVNASETRAHFLFGISMAVTSSGRTEIATRPGSLIFVKQGGVPSAPSILSAGAIAEAQRALEGHSSGDRSADDAAKSSGFSAQNSERGVDGQAALGVAGNGDAQQALTDAAGQRLGGQRTEPAPFFAGTTSSSGAQSGPLGGPGSIGGGPGSTGGGGGSTGGPPPRSGPPFPATPAIGVGNGGLTPAVRGGPPR